MSTRLQRAKEATSKILGQAAGPYVVDAICDHGEGVYLFDQDGKRYLDFSGGAAGTNAIGHADPRVTQAVVEQMNKISHCFRVLWINERAGELAERLIKVSPPNMKWCNFACSGSATTEAAIKLAYQYQLEKGKPEKSIVISRWQSYHGNTLGALSVTGMTSRRVKFGPLLFPWPKIVAPLCYRCPYDFSYPSCNVRCAYALDEMINQVGSRYVSAFIAEPIGGAATACMVPVAEYYPIIREICDKHDVLFIADEVITGAGRTGKWFAIEHWGVNADMIITAKGMNSAYTPLGALLIDDRIGKFFTETDAQFVHGYTMAGNPLSCAVSLAVLDIIEKEGMVERNARLGEYLHRRAREKLSHHPTVGDIRGKGLLIGVELVKNKETKEPFAPTLKVGVRVYLIARNKGCMIYPTTGVIQGVMGDQFLAAPPFIITEDQIDTALDIIDESLTEFEKEVL